VVSSVTRLGEFSLDGRMFTLGSFLLLAWPKFMAYLFPQSKLCITFEQKLGLGYSWGEFFTNSSGHPATFMHYSLLDILTATSLMENAVSSTPCYLHFCENWRPWYLFALSLKTAATWLNFEERQKTPDRHMLLWLVWYRYVFWFIFFFVFSCLNSR
jgi:hypothetical protein